MQTRIEDKQIRRAALYIRVSSEEQAMHGLSLQAQRETLTAYAKENGLSVVGLYADEGITARKKYRNRAQFMRMLRDVESGNIDVILFIKLDRWFRNITRFSASWTRTTSCGSRRKSSMTQRPPTADCI